MSHTKYFEIRDRATFIPIKASRFSPHTEQERYLIAMGGYGTAIEDQKDYILVTRLDGGIETTHSQAHDWNSRTMTTAHKFILQNYDYMETGDVVDVEYILGETEKPKTTQNRGK